jgi:hypothetical protein
MKKTAISDRLHYCLCTKLLLASCSPAELATRHLANQKSYYFTSKKAPFLTTLPVFNKCQASQLFARV